MSFGYSVGDAVLLGQLAWKTVQNSRKACGEHDELTREAFSLHVVIRRLEMEVSKPESPINRPDDKCKEELQGIVVGCEKVLKLLNRVLKKYNTLSEKERSAKKLWHRVRFGNNELADTRDLREKLIYYTSALSLFVNMISMGSIGRVEQQMETAGGDIREIQIAVNGITAHLLSTNNREGSVLTTYADDDKAVWKEFRKELIEDGFSSTIIRKHKRLIKAYIKELGDRGLLDDEDPTEVEELSKLAITNAEHHATPSSRSHSLPKATAMAHSKTESGSSGNHQLRTTENRVEPLPNDTRGNDPYTVTAPTATPKNASEMNGLDVFFHESRFDPAASKIVKLPACERTKTFPINNKILSKLSGHCLTLGDSTNTGRWLILERFQARLQILIESLPVTWIFRAREDIDQIHIYVAKSSGLEIDREEAEDFAVSAYKILERIRILTNWGYPPSSSSHMLLQCLDVFSAQGYHSRRLDWAALEDAISCKSQIRPEVGLENDLGIEQWIRRFDTNFYASAQRLSNAWAKAAELVTKSDFDGMTSLALLFTDDKVLSNPHAQSQERIDDLPPVMSRSNASSNLPPYPRVFNDCGDLRKGSFNNSTDTRTRGSAEGPDRNANPSENGQEEPYCPYHSNDRTGISCCGKRNGTSTFYNPVYDIWQKYYTSDVLRDYKEVHTGRSSKGSFQVSMVRDFTEYVLLQVLIELHAVDLKGSQFLKQQRSDLVDKAQDVLFRIDKRKRLFQQPDLPPYCVLHTPAGLEYLRTDPNSPTRTIKELYPAREKSKKAV